MELQWENLQKAGVKFDLPAERSTVSVVLADGFLQNFAASRLIRHCHGRFEVHFEWNVRSPEQGRFHIIPPGVWHMGRMQAKDGGLQISSFCFTIQPRPASRGEALHTYGTTLEAFLALTEQTTVEDTFGGSAWMHAVRRELLRREDACFDRIHALFHLLMVELALHLPGASAEKRKATAYTVEDFLPGKVEGFFYTHYGDPECSREMMARHLSVSQRQLNRILEQIYHKSFRQMLLEHRMEFAEGWRVFDGLSAAETAKRVGYGSVRGFRLAYEKYHGKKYEEKTGRN